MRRWSKTATSASDPPVGAGSLTAPAPHGWPDTRTAHRRNEVIVTRQRLRPSPDPPPALYEVLDACGAVLGTIARPRPDHFAYHVLKKHIIIGARSLRQLRTEIHEYHHRETT